MIKKPKKEGKTKNPNSGKLGIRPDHPRRRIEIRFCVVGGLWVLVLSFMFDQNRLSGYRDFSVKSGFLHYLASDLYSPVLLYRRDNALICQLTHSLQ